MVRTLGSAQIWYGRLPLSLSTKRKTILLMMFENGSFLQSAYSLSSDSSYVDCIQEDNCDSF